jgi:hypothetical protein
VPLKRAQNSWLLAGALMVLVLLVLALVLVLVLMLVLLSAWCLLWMLARSPRGNPPPSKAVVGWVSATSFGSVGHSAASAAQRWPAKAQLLLLAGRPFIAARDLRGGLGVEISRLWAPAEFLVAKPWLCMRALPRAVTGLLP